MEIELWILLILSFIAQCMVAVGLLGIFISAFSDSFRSRLQSFIGILVAGVVLYLVVYWTLITFVLIYCPGGICT